MQTRIFKELSLLLVIFTLYTTQILAQLSINNGENQGISTKTNSEKKIALVVGNNSYQYTSGLKSPINDATDIKNVLTKLGFEVIFLENGTYVQTLEVINDFENQIKGQNTTALFYYAGHGLQMNNENWLVPIDANLNSSSDIEKACFSLTNLTKSFEKANPNINIIILDACRDNNFIFEKKQNKKGLAIFKNISKGTFVIFSAEPNQVSREGDSRNSPYTAALLKALPLPNTIQEIFETVRKDLQLQYNQTSWEYSSLENDFSLHPNNYVLKTTSNQNSATTDTDNDGLTDDIDECPTEAGLVENYGCPDALTTDTDGDRVMDISDQCPNKFGTIENKGCPDATIIEESKDPFLNQMIVVKGGSFEMGKATSVHQETVKTFKMSKYEVTQVQWRNIMEDNPSQFIGCDECPVENVSWQEVQRFIGLLNARTGKKYRLPTEVEWEYAARGGQKSNNYKYAGSNNIKKIAWCNVTTYNNQTQKVGTKSPNELDIYDLSGNVSEWCSDLSKNKKLENASRNYVIRGGAFNDEENNCEVTNRSSIVDVKDQTVGFRLVLDL